jgi:lipoprotein-anchoring transpeptidase ErfK/SrfK
MMADPMLLFRSLSLASVVSGVALLAGCTLVPDTGATDPDRFVQETAPVYYRPDGQGSGAGLVVLPPDSGVRPPSQVHDLFRTRFHSTYGLPVSNPVHQAMYGQVNEDDFMLPAIPYQRIPPQFLRQEVSYQTTEKPGTVVVDTKTHFLYFVEPGGKAMRYGVGLGSQGYAWSGRGVIQWKQKWPRWTPPAEMVSREPEIRPLSAERGGMNPGPTNPLGARAMYIYKNGKDTLYRIHGTPDWQSVGKAASSGCVRMLNQDVIDLYARVPAKAEIVVE